MTSKLWLTAGLCALLMLMGSSRVALGQACYLTCPLIISTTPPQTCGGIGGTTWGDICQNVPYTLQYPNGNLSPVTANGSGEGADSFKPTTSFGWTGTTTNGTAQGCP